MSGRKLVYFFGGKRTEGKAEMKDLLGGKGANLAEMCLLGIPVPPGFTITTEACTDYYRLGKRQPEGLWEEVQVHLRRLEQEMGAKFGDPANPLLLSVRSGARASMPGMMDTVLNIGLNEETLQGLIAASGDARFAYDCYRRFIAMFSDVVLGVLHERFERILHEHKQRRGAVLDTELDARAWEAVCADYKQLVEGETRHSFPSQPEEQLRLAINAVFESWNTDRAITYRRLHDIPDTWGTAVNVQAMVYGNLGDDCGTGVAFTRDPATGENVFYGEYLMNAQGEDVVAGIRTPQPIATLRERLPDVYAELESIYRRLERHYKDMQDIEFTIQKSKLYMLQTRRGKRTTPAAIRIAVDMFDEGLIDREEAILRVEPSAIDQLLHPMIDAGDRTVEQRILATGLPASPGAAAGAIVFTAAEAEEKASRSERVILVRNETSPEDVGGMAAAQGILTARGGMTSHAAVVARGMGKCCVVGCSALRISEGERTIKVGEVVLKAGDWITLDGTTGRVIAGKVEMVRPKLSGQFQRFMGWADELRQLGVRANADTPGDAAVAIDFGAEGIGLCRTEHMFFAEDRIPIVRQMILARTTEQRQAALDKLLPFQRDDFVGIFRAMEGKPVTIRLLDPPLHEFLPRHEELLLEVWELEHRLASSPGPALAGQLAEKRQLEKRVAELAEFNPMLGHRGCRLGVTFPEIYGMQIEAIFQAAAVLVKEGRAVHPEVMIPLVGHVRELALLKEQVDDVARRVQQSEGVDIPYLVGTMIEVPRAAVTADEIAELAEFFSFGTNDLTQMTFGFSRDDSGTFLKDYVEKTILPCDPFQKLDVGGVGKLVEMGVRLGRGRRPQLKIGICGEHGGEPGSIAFCHEVGMNYVSCSPYRVPIARLAAAQAAVKKPRR